MLFRLSLNEDGSMGVGSVLESATLPSGGLNKECILYNFSYFSPGFADFSHWHFAVASKFPTLFFKTKL